MQQQQFFQTFFGPNGQQVQSGFFGPGAQIMQTPEPVPEYQLHNEVILEIVNNWPFVRWMMDRHRHGELKQVDQMEQTWFNFINQYSIDVENYKTSEDFSKAFWKNPVI